MVRQNIWIKPGETVELPGDRGSITFHSIQRWAGLSIRHDPARISPCGRRCWRSPSLIASLLIKRRRVFARVTAVPGGSRVQLGALAKGDESGLQEHLERLAARVAP